MDAGAEIDVAADRQFSRDEAAVVFRRAAELDRARRPPGAVFDERALEEAALEAGLSPESIRQALAELRAGVLEEPAGTVEGPLGPTQIVITRLLPGRDDAAVVRRELERWFRRQTFEVERSRAGTTVWVPRSGMMADFARGFDLNKRLRLGPVRRATVTVLPIDAGCRVRVLLDFADAARSHRRRRAVRGGLSMAAAAGAATAGVVVDPLLFAGVVPAVGGAAGIWFGVRNAYRHQVARAVTAVEGLLDRLER